MPAPEYILESQHLTVSAGTRTILRDVSFGVRRNQIYGIIGPSGAGKTTLLKCLNRLAELDPRFQVQGTVLLERQPIYSPGVDADSLRSRIGMIFQQPVVFPKSIYQNVVFGIRFSGKVARKEWPDIAERALREAALWNEVKDRLPESALRLSLGQQQRLCLARALSLDPEIVLVDEPTSALDPKSTELIEELILRLKASRTIVLVTHNISQARRLTDWLACLCMRNGAGEIAEAACCDALLNNPKCQEVVEYLSRDPQ